MTAQRFRHKALSDNVLEIAGETLLTYGENRVNFELYIIMLWSPGCRLQYMVLHHVISVPGLIRRGTNSDSFSALFHALRVGTLVSSVRFRTDRYGYPGKIIEGASHG
jgi:hypothetical protein